MTDVNDTGSAGGEAPLVVFKSSGDGPLTAREAARSISDQRRKLNAGAETPARIITAEPPAPAVEESAPMQVEADTAPQEIEVPGETQEAEPAELPPIDPPRSWTKAEQEEFASYPREAQEKIARREQERESAVRRSQNEASELKKGLTAKEQAVEQARQQFEYSAQLNLQALSQAYAGEFADLKTDADITKMSAEDWPRYTRWLEYQRQANNFKQQLALVEQQKTQERKEKFADFTKSETEKLLDKFPELKDEKTRVEVTAGVISMLKGDGFSDEELNALGNGDKELSIYDHRLRAALLDAHKYREAKKQSAKVVAKALPPAQKPGVTPAKNAGNAAEIQNLQKQLKTATGINATRIASQLIRAQRAASG